MREHVPKCPECEGLWEYVHDPSFVHKPPQWENWDWGQGHWEQQQTYASPFTGAASTDACRLPDYQGQWWRLLSLPFCGLPLNSRVYPAPRAQTLLTLSKVKKKLCWGWLKLDQLLTQNQHLNLGEINSKSLRFLAQLWTGWNYSQLQAQLQALGGDHRRLGGRQQRFVTGMVQKPCVYKSVVCLKEKLAKRMKTNMQIKTCKETDTPFFCWFCDVMTLCKKRAWCRKMMTLQKY